MSDSLFFVLSKIFWALVSPDSLLVILALGAWLCLVIGRQALGRRLLSLCALLLLLIAFLPLGTGLLMPLENRFPANAALPAQADGIIVLGGALDPELSASWQQAEMGPAAERLTAFVYLARLYPQAQLLFTGGSGSLLQQEYKEANYVPYLFAQLGLGERAILFESEARDTYENAVNSRALVNPNPGSEWILITSAYHMPRSVAVFCAQQWPVTAYPVDHQTNPARPWRVEFSLLGNLAQLRTGIREWLALIAYRLSGRTAQFLPGNDQHCGLDNESESLN